MAKPLKVDETWLERIASLLDDMEFGSLHIVVHEGQIVQMERTERKRFGNTSSGAAPLKMSSQSSAKPASSSPRTGVK
ncbi:YezD family protein [Paenibacillus sp. GCM10028914]|uniref:YezD family protein n=1 Tax=Paenibacillus sp. GCM10028914 TaxID=3273416 RepID=UPI00360DDB41